MGRKLVVVAGAALVAVAACTKAPAPAPPSCATCVVADDKGFSPSSLVLAQGKPGETREVTFTRTTDDTCARDVVFPELNVKAALPLNAPVAIKVPVDRARTLTFQCGMGMYKSSLVVTGS